MVAFDVGQKPFLFLWAGMFVQQLQPVAQFFSKAYFTGVIIGRVFIHTRKEPQDAAYEITTKIQEFYDLVKDNCEQEAQCVEDRYVLPDGDDPADEVENRNGHVA